MSGFRHFTDIHAWQTAKTVAVAVYRLGDTPPLTRDFTLKDQMRRAALSIMSNIGEGFARGTDKQFIHFLDIARGSAAELESQLLLTSELHPALSQPIETIRQDLDRTLVLIARLTAYLTRSTTSGHPDARTSGRLPHA